MHYKVSQMGVGHGLGEGWEVRSSFEQQQEHLFWVTGSSTVPLKGCAALQKAPQGASDYQFLVSPHAAVVQNPHSGMLLSGLLPSPLST